MLGSSFKGQKTYFEPQKNCFELLKSSKLWFELMESYKPGFELLKI